MSHDRAARHRARRLTEALGELIGLSFVGGVAIYALGFSPARATVWRFLITGAVLGLGFWLLERSGLIERM